MGKLWLASKLFAHIQASIHMKNCWTGQLYVRSSSGGNIHHYAYCYFIICAILCTTTALFWDHSVRNREKLQLVLLSVNLACKPSCKLPAKN